MRDAKNIASEIVWSWPDGEEVSAYFTRAIAAAIQAERDRLNPPADHVRLPDGRDVKVLGTLPMTADGYVVGADATIYWSNGAGFIHEMCVDDRLNVTNGMLAIAGDCYSTRAAAESARE